MPLAICQAKERMFLMFRASPASSLSRVTFGEEDMDRGLGFPPEVQVGLLSLAVDDVMVSNTPREARRKLL